MRLLMLFCQSPGHSSCTNLVEPMALIPYSTQWPLQMFNFCAISAIDTLLSPENHGSGFFHFLITGWCWEASWAPCSLSWTFLSSSEKENCPHTEHLAQHMCIITYHASLFFLGEQCTQCSHVQCPIQTHTLRVRSRLSVCWLVTQSATVLPTLKGVTHISDHQENCGNFLRIPYVSNVIENKGLRKINSENNMRWLHYLEITKGFKKCKI